MSSSATTESSKSTNKNKHQASSGNSQFVALIAFGLVAVLIACSHTLTSAFAQNLSEKASAFGETTAVVASTTRTTTLSNVAEQQPYFQLALDDSFGFFDDVPDAKWLIRKRISNERKRIHTPVPVREADIRKPQGIYQANWNPDFSCEFEDFVGSGGDGGKWICDPHRISQENCIVYSVGSNGKFDFEEHVNLLLPQCEVHIFDFTNYEQQMLNEGKVNASFHAWGIKGNDGTVNAHAKHARNMKSMKQTVQDLGHVGRRIDIFKIDCEGCEWNSYKDWFDDSGVTGLHQILVETHKIPGKQAVDFFEYLHQKGYAMFHREPNIQYGGGTCIEFSFLQLNPSFFMDNVGNQTVA